MRLKLATFLLMAGTIAACSSNPPPPPPMAEAPPPAVQPPPPTPPADGLYRGTAQKTSDDRRCHDLHGNQTARVRNGTVTLMGQRGAVAPDGTITPAGHSSLAGSIANGTMDVTANRGRCSYHFTLTHA